MVLNPNGCVWLGDKFAPWVWPGKAGGDISGGQFLKVVSGTAPISSGADTFDTADVIVVTGASGADVIGLATMNQSSGTNNYVSFATKGLFIVTAGLDVDPTDNMSVAIYSDSVEPVTAVHRAVGKVWTNAASGGYCVLNLDI